MLFLLIFAVGLPLWLLAEELMRLRSPRHVAPAPMESARARKLMRVAFARSGAGADLA